MAAHDFSLLRFSAQGGTWQIDTARTFDISIPLAFDAPQPNFFGAPPAAGAPLTAGSFVGDVRRGGSCNCATYSLTPHCNGTHTECIGHITSERIGVRDVPVPALLLARLVTLSPRAAATSTESTDPAPQPGDLLVTRESLDAALGDATLQGCSALIVRTTPNNEAKLTRDYGPDHPAPFFSADFMRAIVAAGIEHFVCDLPSVDRAEDEGRLTAHRIFWGLPRGGTDAQQATRRHATITELAYIADDVADGLYVLNLQVAPFVADAAPSRPLLLPLVPV